MNYTSVKSLELKVLQILAKYQYEVWPTNEVAFETFNACNKSVMEGKGGYLKKNRFYSDNKKQTSIIDRKKTTNFNATWPLYINCTSDLGFPWG